MLYTIAIPWKRAKWEPVAKADFREAMRTIGADGRLRWGADGYLLSFQSYPLLLKKASSIGKMFYWNLFATDHDAFQTWFYRLDAPRSQHS